MIDVRATLNNLHNVLPNASVETLLKIIDAIVEDNISSNLLFGITNPYSKFKIIS